MRLTIITFILIAFGALTASPASAAPSFDSDCVSTQWVIRNRGLEPFLVATPAGEPIGMIELGAVYEPADDLTSVIISDTIIVRPSCEVFAPKPGRLPATGTGTSLVLAALALTLVTAGAATRRVARIKV